MSYKSDLALAKLVSEGDSVAFQQFCELYYQYIFKVFCKLLQDQDWARDFTQQLCLVLPKRLGTYQGKSKLTTWLYEVIRNECRMAWRQNQSKTFRLVFTGEGGTPNHFHQNDDTIPCPQNSYEFWQVLDQLIPRLPKGQRKQFILWVAGYTDRERARITKLTVGTCKSQLHKARKKIKEVMQLNIA